MKDKELATLQWVLIGFGILLFVLAGPIATLIGALRPYDLGISVEYFETIVRHR